MRLRGIPRISIIRSGGDISDCITFPVGNTEADLDQQVEYGQDHWQWRTRVDSPEKYLGG